MNWKTCRLVSVRDPHALKVASKVVRNGGVVVYPTETSYALGCNALDAKAVRRIYKMKGRDRSKPLPVIVADEKMALRFAVLTPQANALIRRFMPGPLTIAAKRKVAMPACGKARTVAFRIPSSEFARKLSKKAGVPIVSTSANVSGGEQLYEIAHVFEQFSKSADLIVDCGDLARQPASTLVCLAAAPKILREGPIPARQVMDALKTGRKTNAGKAKAKSARKRARRKQKKRAVKRR